MNEVQGKHNLILENRSRLMLSGVTDVDCFNEEEIRLFTQLGELTIRGRNLHINEMSVESGDISVEGDVLDLAANIGIINKSGAWYAYNDAKIGQGRENAKQFLRENPDILKEVDDKVREYYQLNASDADKGEDE